MLFESKKKKKIIKINKNFKKKLNACALLAKVYFEQSFTDLNTEHNFKFAEFFNIIRGIQLAYQIVVSIFEYNMLKRTIYCKLSDALRFLTLHASAETANC